MSRMQDDGDDRGRLGAAQFDRRNFLKVVGAGAATGALPLVPAAAAESQSAATKAAQSGTVSAGAPATQTPPQTYRFLNTDEGDFVEAAVDMLIPTDSVGPGALELGVANFIDGQMSGGYGNGERLYIQGPFPEGATTEQGYQLPMTPSELLRAGMLDVRAYCTTAYGKSFSELAPSDRARVLNGLEHDEIKLDTVPATAFFNELLQLTIDGYLADPMYGGNRDSAAWQMIGFPGPNAMYTDKIAPYRNKPYTAKPEGIDELTN